MKIYIISQSNPDWDEYISAIVAAENEEEARLIHPSDWQKQEWNGKNWGYTQKFDNQDDYFSVDTTWDAPDKLEVKYLFETKENISKGLIHSSFKAG